MKTYRTYITEATDSLEVDIKKYMEKKRQEGQTYPEGGVHLAYYTKLKSTKGKKNISIVSADLADFLAYGDKMSKSTDKLAEKIRTRLNDYLIKRRKEIIPPMDMTAINKLIKEKVMNGDKKVFDMRMKDYEWKYFYERLLEIIDIMKEPHLVGLPEQGDYDTPKKEINSIIMFLKKKSKHMFGYPFDEPEFYVELKKTI